MDDTGHDPLRWLMFVDKKNLARMKLAQMKLDSSQALVVSGAKPLAGEYIALPGVPSVWICPSSGFCKFPHLLLSWNDFSWKIPQKQLLPQTYTRTKRWPQMAARSTPNGGSAWSRS